MFNYLFARLLSSKAWAQFGSGCDDLEGCTFDTQNFGIEGGLAGGGGGTGTLDIPGIIKNIVDALHQTILALCVAIFIAGAFFFAASAGDEQRKSLGKDLMIGAAMGLSIVVGARAILNIAYSFLYAA